jgi:hypothetical protein
VSKTDAGSKDMRIAATATRSADGGTDSDNNNFDFDIVDPCKLDAS